MRTTRDLQGTLRPGRRERRPGRALLALACTLLSASCAARRAPPPPAPAADPLATLQREIDEVLVRPAFAHGRWSVLVKSLETGGTLYARDPRHLMMPASTLKVLTAAVAAERLGWDFHFETRLVASGPIRNGVLHGDLLVVGSGDPTLDGRGAPALLELQTWASRLRAAGLVRIDGRIVGDDDALEEPGWGFGWSWDDLADGYAAPVGALQLNENSAILTLQPGVAPGQPATASLAPAETGLRLENWLSTAAADSPASDAYARRPGSPLLLVTGTIPIASPPAYRKVAIENPTLYFVTNLKGTIERAGIAVAGDAIDIDDLPSKPQAGSGTVLLGRTSPPLRDMLVTCLKASSNLYAETLLKTLGKVAAGRGTSAAGLQVVRETLASWGVPVDPLIMRDGSGLSRYNYLTAELLTAIQARMAGDPAWAAALPVAGRDGTLAGRMKSIEGRAHAKTGSFANVRALSGYVTTADGEPLVFTIIGNHFEVPPAEITSGIDRIVETLAGFARRIHREQ